MQRVGFIGLGSMGGALAARLAEQSELYVFDLDADRVDEARKAGATPVADVQDMAGQCPVILTCLPTSQHVRRVLGGPDGLGAKLPAGTMVIDCTSGDPQITKALAAELALRGVDLVDAPVSGGPQGATAGTIAILVGGSDEQYARAEPVLRLVSSNVRHVGGVGAGHVVKLLNNVLAAGHRMLAFETAAAAAANGVDPRTFIDVVNLASGRSYATEITMPRHVFGEQLVQGFSLGLMTKDVGLGRELIPAELEARALTPLVHERLLAALGDLGPDADINLTLEAYESEAGATVATSARPANSPVEDGES